MTLTENGYGQCFTALARMGAQDTNDEVKDYGGVPRPIDEPAAAALVLLDEEVSAAVCPARGVPHDIHCISVSSSVWTEHDSHLQPFTLKRAPHPLLAIFCPHCGHALSPTNFHECASALQEVGN
jgi:hypothetical protein